MKWLRWYHGTAADPKFGGIARACNTTRERVVFVWAMLLESASENEDRGIYEVRPGDIADVLNCDDGAVEAILYEMDARSMICDGDIVKWEKRQPSRDDTAKRQRKKRANDAGAALPARDIHVTTTVSSDSDAEVSRTGGDGDAHVTPLDTDSDSDSESSEAEASGAPAPPEDNFEIPLALRQPHHGDFGALLFSAGLDWLASVLEKPPAGCRALLGLWLKDCGQDHQAVYELLAECQAQQVADPVSWVTAALKPKTHVADALAEARAG